MPHYTAARAQALLVQPPSPTGAGAGAGAGAGGGQPQQPQLGVALARSNRWTATLDVAGGWVGGNRKAAEGNEKFPACEERGWIGGDISGGRGQVCGGRKYHPFLELRCRVVVSR